MKETYFKEDGLLYCRGEEAFTYTSEDKVSIMNEEYNGLVQIMFMEGKAKGQISYVDKNLLKHT